ncbi:hypothetical protein FEE95_07400 [Maribacter algarum]|uniref:Uncharacterized protein n=2 Tax=Maribacter algarum (ex Zhang et al. 2020) TaxID=2578118 RepID=A0A5S3PWM2_9FLAO|nr:hypothetical protein FEE95_07400 [Maribacter algarum]
MKAIFTLLVLYTLFSCNNDDRVIEEEEACVGIVDFAPSTVFLIELVDENGTNLIENGSYADDQFRLQLNGSYWNDGLGESDEKFIRLYPAGSAGDNRYLIHLSESETDTLDYNISFLEVRSRSDSGLFCGEKIVLNSVSYNQIAVDTTKVEQVSPNLISVIPITVVKDTN